MTKAWHSLASLSICAVLAVASLPAGADDAAGGQSQSLRYIQMSRELHDIAIRNSDPVMMLAAATLRRDAGAKAGDLGGLEADGSGSAAEDAFDWEAWLDEAVKISGGSQTISGLADDIRSDMSKGVQGGAIYSTAHVKARSSRKYKGIAFVGGQFAEVYSESSGVADIDMFVYDRSGALICSQTDASNVNQCGWTPSATGPFSIVVENKSDVGTDYALMTN